MFVVGEWEGALENFRLEEEKEPFDLKFFIFCFVGAVSKNTRSAKLHFTLFFQLKSLRAYFLFKKVKPLPITKNKPKLLTFDNASLATAFSLKPVGRNRMKSFPAKMMLITESLVFVVVPVLESKGL